jgi:hypothetical protein
MKSMNLSEKIKSVLDHKKSGISARIFLSREDGITIYDSIQNQTTSSVSALVSGVWQASEALVGLTNPNQDILEFRLGFDTSSQGILLLPLLLSGKKYFLGAIYKECLNPGQLKRQLVMIKEEMNLIFFEAPSLIKSKIHQTKTNSDQREGFLFQEISDDEIDRLFTTGI